jgi:hypothetical protein
MVNTGGTRAIIRESVCRTYIGEWHLPMRRPYEGEQSTRQRQAIQPGESIPFAFAHSGALEADVVKDILASGRLNFFVLGWIRYTDDLNISRFMAFCRMYDVGRIDL